MLSYYCLLVYFARALGLEPLEIFGMYYIKLYGVADQQNITLCDFG